MKRPIISFGDALKACFALKPDAEAVRQVMVVLGLASERATPAPRNVGAAKPSSTSTVVSVQRRRPRTDRLPESGRSTTRHPVSPSGGRGRTAIVRRVREGGAKFQAPEWLKDDGAPKLETLDAAAAPETTPLFSRIQRRGILTAAIATSVREGELDVDAIVVTLSAGLPIRELPRLTRQTTRWGCQVLKDRGPGMAPFREDVAQVVDALDDILPGDCLEAHDFVACPSRGLLRVSKTGFEPWQPPPQGMPILVISDLGIGGPMMDHTQGTIAEWVAFADNARAAGCRLVGLVPYEATRWPPRVARAMTLVHWSERTLAGHVRRAMRDAARRLQ